MKKYIEEQIKLKKEVIENFSKRLSTDPINAFCWDAETAMDATAYLDTLTLILAWLNDGKSPEKIIDIIKDEIFNEVRYCTVKTAGICVSYMKLAKITSYHKIIEELQLRVRCKGILNNE